jgi:hypothetical protein
VGKGELDGSRELGVPADPTADLPGFGAPVCVTLPDIQRAPFDDFRRGARGIIRPPFYWRLEGVLEESLPPIVQSQHPVFNMPFHGALHRLERAKFCPPSPQNFARRFQTMRPWVARVTLLEFWRLFWHGLWRGCVEGNQDKRLPGLLAAYRGFPAIFARIYAVGLECPRGSAMPAGIG